MSETLAFTAENVCKLTGLSARQLAYWDATDFFSPELLDEHRRRAFGRLYSFRDVVGLRARIATLAIWNFREPGYRAEDILKEYPRLTLSDVSAAIEFEADRHKAA
jgi:uncharacterized protein (DUF433 family)